MVSTIEGFHCNTEAIQLTDMSWLKVFAIIFDKLRASKHRYLSELSKTRELTQLLKLEI